MYCRFSAIIRRARLSESDLRAAARAGALCMVVRTKDWKPQPGDVIAEAILARKNPPFDQDCKWL
jgi:hypothetical protein